MRLLLFKAKKYAVGEISQKTGMRKVAPGKWVLVASGKKVASTEASKTGWKKAWVVPDKRGNLPAWIDESGMAIPWLGSHADSLRKVYGKNADIERLSQGKVRVYSIGIPEEIGFEFEGSKVSETQAKLMYEMVRQNYDRDLTESIYVDYGRDGSKGASFDNPGALLRWLKSHIGLQKARRAYSVGEISETTGMKKVGPGKWVNPKTGKAVTREPGHGKVAKPDEHYSTLLDNAISKYSIASYVVLDTLEDQFGVSDYQKLSDVVRMNPGMAAKIYKTVVDEMRRELREEYKLPSEYTPKTFEAISPAEAALVRNARSAVKELGEVLSHLKGGKKVRLMVKVDPKTKGAYKGVTGGAFMYEEQLKGDEPPVVPPSVLKDAQTKMGGWDLKGPPKAEHVRGLLPMIRSERGKFVPGTPIEFVHQKNEKKRPIEVEVPFREDEQGLFVPVKQAVKGGRGKGDRLRAASHGVLTVPYALAVQFLVANVPSKRARADYLGQLRRSKGFRKFADSTTARIGGKASTGKQKKREVA